MAYKLLATDMDGTLLMNNKTLSQENIKALRYAKKQGIEIAICTGRPYVTVKPYLDKLGFDCWVITNNGGVIRNSKGDILSVDYMKPQALEEVIKLLLQEKIYFHISDEKCSYIRNRYERIKNIEGFILRTGASRLRASLHSLWAVLLSGSHKKVDFTTFVSEGRNAVNIFILSQDQQQRRALRDKLKGIRGINITSSGFDNIEVLDEDATKGKALEKLSKILNITEDSIIAVGDNYNDLSMIEYAGLGVAMKNAEEEIIERADWVTKSNEEDGIAHLVKHFIETPKEDILVKE